LKEGSATITAKTVDGEKTATCKITVKGTAVTVTLSKDKVSLYKGGSVTVTATATGGEEPFTYEWKSANTKVATVSSDGTITGKGIGVTTVTVTASNGATASCEVTVTAKNNETDGSSSSGTGSSSGSSSEPESSSSSSDELQIVPSSEKVSVTTGGNRTLVYEVINGDPDLQVTFKSSNPDVVTVDGNGEIIGRGEGVATVTLTAEDGTTCTWQITVTKGINIWQ
ncbi:MAG: Ig-like domain-containing protein, partial [Oscillospiraceae bacterium]|nr:Ig-like domain-containing protein [Oscillospiraceae bacterium]